MEMAIEEISTKYPTLYHYTDWGGLEGMLKTKEIWATHINYMNDEREFIHAKDYLKDQLGQEYSDLLYRAADGCTSQVSADTRHRY
jgi:hypothetical protein